MRAIEVLDGIIIKQELLCVFIYYHPVNCFPNLFFRNLVTASIGKLPYTLC